MIVFKLLLVPLQGATNLFSGIVNHDGIISPSSFYYSTEELWFPEWEFGGPPYATDGTSPHPTTPGPPPCEVYEKWNPAHPSRIRQWNTPMLVIQGGKDFRVAESEGLAAFTAARRRGVKAKLLYFPQENHWVLKREHSVKWHEVVLQWCKESVQEKEKQ